MRPSNGYPNPQKVGEWLLARREDWMKYSWPSNISGVADLIPWDEMLRYPQDETLGQLATRVYQSELKQRAKQGDKFAKATLEEGGWNEPS